MLRSLGKSTCRRSRGLKYTNLFKKNVFGLSELEKFNESFLSGSSSAYIESLYDKWVQDRSSVHKSWDLYFSNLARNVPQSELFNMPPSTTAKDQSQEKPSEEVQKLMSEILNIKLLMNEYQFSGHEFSEVDPLNAEKLGLEVSMLSKKTNLDNLNLEYFGFKNEDLERDFSISDVVPRGLTTLAKTWKLKELLDTLERIYCKKVTYEYLHCEKREERNWLREKIEAIGGFKTEKKDKLRIFNKIAQNDVFDQLLKKTFPSSTSQSLEGVESFIVALDSLIETAAKAKMEHLVVGMPYRGRINALAFLLDKPIGEILAEFQEIKNLNPQSGSHFAGDTKDHLGTTHDYISEDGHVMRASLLANSSNLESINPVVTGKIRGIQDSVDDSKKNKALAVLVHGDTSITGRGVVYETTQFQDLYKYRVGGTIHIVINNQIGVTTNPIDSRSGLYCTEVAKIVGAPVFHVNAQEPELIRAVTNLAFEYRDKFNKDVFIDIVGFRRNSFHENEDPSITHPLTYKRIKEIPSLIESYGNKLIEEGVINKSERKEIMENFSRSFHEAYDNSKNNKFNIRNWVQKPWEEVKTPHLYGKIKDTGVSHSTLKYIGNMITKIPQSFEAHPQIRKIFEARQKSIEDGVDIDFATAESLAFASLLHEGFRVRLSGQDVERGTFSHRHAVIKHQSKPENYTAIRNILKGYNENRFIVKNSHLSESGVLGFEYGYSLANPNCLVMWEAQFGDFSNGCQPIIDSYISSGETKWGQQTGLVMLLPHGMDGQGPEHSSARMERYLMLSDDDIIHYASLNTSYERIRKEIERTNIQIVQCTTPSNYFHVLRRQLRRLYRKPLVCFNSKRLLRFKGAYSTLGEFEEGLRFSTIYGEAHPTSILPPEQIKLVVLCSGQYYYDLLEKRSQLQRKDVALIRIEQLAPFPYDYLKTLLTPYANADFMWSQEEHQNYGPWNFVRPRIKHALNSLKRAGVIKKDNLEFRGRKTSASTAVGSPKTHAAQLKEVLETTFA